MNDRDGCFQILRRIFTALTIISLRDKNLQHLDLPRRFCDIVPMNVYHDPKHGIMREDWEQYLNGKGQLWIITPLNYEKGGSKIVRKASEYHRWDNHTSKRIEEGDIAWYERKFKLVERTNKKQETKGAGGQKYMFEYSPADIKPSHALCRLVVDKPLSSSQQREGKQIVHTESNNGDRGETSLSHESRQQGGNSENATRYYNDLSDLEMFFRRIIQGEELSKFMKHFSKDYIVKVFSLKMDQIPAASPKEHCTKAAVTNPTKRRRCTNKKTIKEEDVSIQMQEQAKVGAMLESSSVIPFKEPRFPLYNNQHGQMLESTSYQGDSSGNSIQYQWVSTPPLTIAGLCNSCVPEMGESASYPGDPTLGMSFEDLYNPEMFQPNAALQDPNFILNYTEGSRSGHQTGESTSYPGDPNLGMSFEDLCNPEMLQDPNFIVNYTDDRLCHQMDELDAALQDNQNRFAPDPNTNNVATTVGWFNPQVQVQALENINGNNIYESLPDWNPEIQHPPPRPPPQD